MVEQIMIEPHGFTVRAALQLLLLCAVIPVQFWLTQNSNEASRQYQVQQ